MKRSVTDSSKDHLSQLQSSTEEGNKFTGVAIIVFKTQKAQKDILKQQMKNKVISFFKKLLCIWCCDEDSNKLVYERAPEPTDIFWENLHVTQNQRSVRIGTVFLATLALIVGCFFSLYALDKVKR